jgi:predicted MFS family arabinose efflux permease
MFGATTLVAHAVGPSASEHIARAFGFRRLFELVAGVALLALMLFAWLGRGERRPVRRQGAGIGMLALARRPSARAALVAGVATALAFGTALHFMPVFVRSRGLEAHTPFFVAYVVAAILARLLLPSLGDRIGHRPVGACAVFAFSAAVMSLAAVHHVGALVACAAGFGVAHGIAYPAINALFVEGTPEGARGRAMALYNLSFNAGITLAAFVAGELAERAGYSVMWLTMGAAAALGAIALVVDRPD